MKAAEIKRLREELEQKRRDLVESYRKTQAETRETGGEATQDLADQASDSYRKEFLYSLTDNERETLRLVDDALQRIEDGTYEECQNCGDPIGERRLQAIPWAAFCIDCQEELEAEEEE